MKIKPKTITKEKHNSEDSLPIKSLASMNKHRSFVFYGRSGTGKTTLAISFPQRVLLLDVKDKGADSGSEYAIEDVAGMDVTSWDDFEMVYYYLKKHPKEYATVIIDTMSQLQQLCVEHIISKKKKVVERAGDWGTMTRKDWGEVASLMKEWIINFRDLPMEVVFIAQDRIFNIDEDAEEKDQMLAPEVGPRLSPAIAAHLNAAVSVVGNTFIRRKIKVEKVDGKKKEREIKQYCLRIGPDSMYVTKVRKPKGIELPDIIVNPDYEKLMSVIKGE